MARTRTISDRGGKWRATSSRVARRKMPASVFLKPRERKYPVKVKRNGWQYSLAGLMAAYKRARQHGETGVAAKAKRIADPMRKRLGKPPLGASSKK